MDSVEDQWELSDGLQTNVFEGWSFIRKSCDARPVRESFPRIQTAVSFDERPLTSYRLEREINESTSA